jgi:hypothetical protein
MLQYAKRSERAESTRCAGVCEHQTRWWWATDAWRQRLVKVASAGFEGGVARSVGQTLSASGEGVLDVSVAAPRGFGPF